MPVHVACARTPLPEEPTRFGKEFWMVVLDSNSCSSKVRFSRPTGDTDLERRHRAGKVPLTPDNGRLDAHPKTLIG